MKEDKNIDISTNGCIEQDGKVYWELSTYGYFCKSIWSKWWLGDEEPILRINYLHNNNPNEALV